jgi:hypothetical protein
MAADDKSFVSELIDFYDARQPVRCNERTDELLGVNMGVRFIAPPPPHRPEDEFMVNLSVCKEGANVVASFHVFNLARLETLAVFDADVTPHVDAARRVFLNEEAVLSAVHLVAARGRDWLRDERWWGGAAVVYSPCVSEGVGAQL